MVPTSMIYLSSINRLSLKQNLSDDGCRSKAFFVLARTRRDLNCARHLINNVGIVCKKSKYSNSQIQVLAYKS
jgi:hypothetical protein